MSSINHLQKIAESATANGAVFKSIYEISLNAAEKIFSRNCELAREFTEAVAHRKDGLDFGDLAGVYAQYFERSGGYLSEIGAICSSTQAEVFKVGTLSAEEIAKKFIAQFEGMLQLHPVDDSRFSEWLMSALSTAGTAYGKIVDTSRQITESSLVVATHLGHAAANTASKAARKTA
ncbi:phasin family protein [Zoogloea sp.]|uniref:phasin family protein n=1 Tax=Zoogloea sp. TaxID=49181 RepID=UPI001416564B|nr:MAG: phasin family protein [Zoogloea sp.]